MSLQDKINSAKPTTFLTDGLSEEEVKQAVDEGKQKLECLLSAVRNAVEIEDIESEDT